ADAGPESQLGEEDEKEANTTPILAAAVAAAVCFMILIGLYAPPDFVQHFTVFVLACFVGWQVVWNVESSLHTPLMSVTNAISGIIIVGGLVQVGVGAAQPVLWLAAAAILVATINVFGGFVVTQRMLGMFRADDEADNGGRDR
ncbi:MAG: proton-translocating transhydrogenase family protein, partial [Bradymonadaceae bacterium]